MSEIYNGYELNTAGDKNWADREVTLHKAQIDADLAIDTRLDALESATTSSLITNGTTRSTGTGPYTALLGNFATDSIYHIYATNKIDKILNYQFNDGSLTNWAFMDGATGEAAIIDGKNTIHVHIPAGVSGYALFTPPEVMTTMGIPYYAVINTKATSVSDPHGPAAISFLSNGSSLASANWAANSTWFWQPNVIVPSTTDISVKISFGGGGAPFADVDIYLDYVALTTYITSQYTATATISGGSVTLSNNSGSGVFSTAPTITAQGISEFIENPSYKCKIVHSTQADISFTQIVIRP